MMMSMIVTDDTSLGRPGGGVRPVVRRIIAETVHADRGAALAWTADKSARGWRTLLGERPDGRWLALATIRSDEPGATPGDLADIVEVIP